MSKLDLAWTSWTRLNWIDRARFLTRLREAYREERAARTCIVSYSKDADLSDLTLSEADLRGMLE